MDPPPPPPHPPPPLVCHHSLYPDQNLCEFKAHVPDNLSICLRERGDIHKIGPGSCLNCGSELDPRSLAPVAEAALLEIQRHANTQTSHLLVLA